jgi:hypothetical protein
MPYVWMPGPLKKKHDTYFKMMQPVNNTLPDLTPLTSGCNRPLQIQIYVHKIKTLMNYPAHRTGHLKKI